MNSRSSLSRRDFLKVLGAAGAVGIPSLLGYQFWRSGEGENPIPISPYAVNFPGEGRGRDLPLLLLLPDDSASPFGPYLAEVLVAEGINAFRTVSSAEFRAEMLGTARLVILGSGPIDRNIQEALSEFVHRGGALIGLRPPPEMATLFGVEAVNGRDSPGYLIIDSAHPSSRGFPNEPLQIHSEADSYSLAGAEPVAWFSDSLGNPGRFPAITIHERGEGLAMMWAFDLVSSIVLTRQGNPAQVGVETDGRPGIRAHDAFVGWMDLDRIHLPQADEQMRILSRLIHLGLESLAPIPRLWYFPGKAMTMLIATGDSHSNPAFTIQQVLHQVEEHGGRFSVYFTPPDVSDWRRAMRRARWWAAELPVVGEKIANPYGFPSPVNVQSWRDSGHEFTFHPYVEDGVEEGIQKYWREFTALGYDPLSPTVRTHRVLWDGWVETARIQASYDIRMNMDFYHIGPAFRKADGTWAYGHFTGSGLPMKFIDQEGKILNSYQQLTQLVDEHLFKVPWGGHVLLEPDEAVEVSKNLLQASLNGGYSALAAQFHTDPFFAGGDYAVRAEAWLNGTLDFAASNGIPIWTAQDWLRFTEWRHDVRVGDYAWDPQIHQLAFRVESEVVPEIEASILIPLRHDGTMLEKVILDGSPQPFTTKPIRGVEYAWVPLLSGDHHIVAAYVE